MANPNFVHARVIIQWVFWKGVSASSSSAAVATAAAAAAKGRFVRV
jgi:hypothetical protein